MRSTFRLLLAYGLLLALCGPASAAPAPTIAWRETWDDTVFAQARREHRLVLIDLQAVWCHWCHVMDEQTYRDPGVVDLINKYYLPVKADQDGNPDLSNRYGDWGWPATIVLAADGSELVKRRGFIAPDNMRSLLQAIVDDPTPGPSVQPEQPSAPAPATAGLGSAARERLNAQFSGSYDETHGGWGDALKYIDAHGMELALLRAKAGDAAALKMARQTLDANLALIDPVWGGVYQYSDEQDWSSPHFEKIMSYQADDLRLYSMAYAIWKDPRYLKAAQAIQGYLLNFLASRQGAFYVSQDADLDSTNTGHVYYALTDVQRRKLGMPRIDTHVYARENGWAIDALCHYAEAGSDGAALAAAERAARWVIAHRGLPHGGFRHDARDLRGPFLGDTVAMGTAFMSLYRSTANKYWLQQASAALAFIEQKFHDADGGFDTAPAPARADGVFAKPVRLYEENVAVARLANRLSRAGDARGQAQADHAMRFLASPSLVESNRFQFGTLLAVEEAAYLAQSR